MTKRAVLLPLLLALPQLAFPSGFRSMAKELSQAARQYSVGRVAVLPFVPADGGRPGDGRNISEKLLTQIVRLGKVQVVERSQLRGLMSEHRLGQTGAVDPKTLRALGRILAVEGLVVGSFVSRGEELLVNARLIHAETGVVYAAVEHKAEKDWVVSSLWVQPPELSVEAPDFPEEAVDMRDAPAQDSCENAPERVDRLEESMLDLKARYWAIQLRNKASLAHIKVNPGSTITDPFLKKTFYERMHYWYGLQEVPEMTPDEVKRFISLDEQAYSLYRRCGV